MNELGRNYHRGGNKSPVNRQRDEQIDNFRKSMRKINEKHGQIVNGESGQNNKEFIATISVGIAKLLVENGITGDGNTINEIESFVIDLVKKEKGKKGPEKER